MEREKREVTVFSMDLLTLERINSLIKKCDILSTSNLYNTRNLLNYFLTMRQLWTNVSVYDPKTISRETVVEKIKYCKNLLDNILYKKKKSLQEILYSSHNNNEKITLEAYNNVIFNLIELNQLLLKFIQEAGLLTRIEKFGIPVTEKIRQAILPER